jgi:hypothetical protein
MLTQQLCLCSLETLRSCNLHLTMAQGPSAFTRLMADLTRTADLAAPESLNFGKTTPRATCKAS